MSKTRNNRLDFLRGNAVIFMIATHTVSILYRGDSAFLDFVNWWGATVCFTIFLFVSGAVFGRKASDSNISRQKSLRRLVSLTLSYYLLAVWILLGLEGERFDLRVLLDVLTLRHIPVFTEFILAFVIYAAIIVALGDQLVKVVRKKPLLVLLIVAVFLLSQILYRQGCAEGYLCTLKGLLVGHERQHFFGVMSYFPVFALGLIWGGWIKNEECKRTAIVLGPTFALLFFALKFTGLSVYERWPPSSLFLLYGIIYSMATLFAAYFFKRLSERLAIISFVGRHAFGMYFGHLIVLVVIEIFMGPVTLDLFPVTVLLILVPTLTVLPLWIKYKLVCVSHGR